MRLEKTNLNILVIEDNPGDFVLIKDFLLDEINDALIVHANSFDAAKQRIVDSDKIDVVLLDLVLPDLQGKQLVKNIINLVADIPVIVLTGLSDKAFGVKTLSLGVSDYLLKDEITSSQLIKSISHSLERKRLNIQLKQSEENYRHLFYLNPIPSWVYDPETLAILNVNKAAVQQYGYNMNEFSTLTIKDLRAKEAVPLLEDHLKKWSHIKSYSTGTIRHRKKSGSLFDVEIQSNQIIFNGKICRLVLAIDVSERIRHLSEIEGQNQIMREIAWTQSPLVRAPLARLIGLTNIMIKQPAGIDFGEILIHVLNSANELDCVVRDIVRKTESVENNRDKTAEKQ